MLRPPVPPRSTELVGEGLALAGWDWDGLDTAEEMGGVRWGRFVVTGTWDGEVLTLTRPPAPEGGDGPGRGPTPPRAPAPPRAKVEDADLIQLQRHLHDVVRRRRLGILTSWVEKRRTGVVVVYDDGSVQDALDTVLGGRAARVASALQPAQPLGD